MTKRKSSTKRKGNTKRKNMLLLAGLGAGALFMLKTKGASAEQIQPPAGIGGGNGAILGTQGASTTTTPTSSAGTTGQPIYNISFEAPTLEATTFGDDGNTAPKKTSTAPSGGGGSISYGSTNPIKVGSYSGTATSIGTDGNNILNFGENAQAVTLTKKQVTTQGAGTVALTPIGNTVNDVVSAGNVASIIAHDVASSGTVTTSAPKKAPTPAPVNTGWANPVGAISSWWGSFFG